eukprot:1473576-Amphidinium_carterae.1
MENKIKKWETSKPKQSQSARLDKQAIKIAFITLAACDFFKTIFWVFPCVNNSKRDGGSKKRDDEQAAELHYFTEAKAYSLQHLAKRAKKAMDASENKW